jgi:hypothetical protein
VRSTRLASAMLKLLKPSLSGLRRRHYKRNAMGQC